MIANPQQHTSLGKAGRALPSYMQIHLDYCVDSEKLFQIMRRNTGKITINLLS